MRAPLEGEAPVAHPRCMGHGRLGRLGTAAGLRLPALVAGFLPALPPAFLRFLLASLAVPLLLASLAHAQEPRRTIRRSPLVDGRYEVYEDGRRVGTIDRSPLVDGRYELRRDGRRVGTLDEDPLDGGLRLRDEAGRERLRLEPELFGRGGYEVRSQSRRVGELRGSPLVEGQVDAFDAGGRRSGTVRRNPLRDDTYDVEGSVPGLDLFGDGDPGDP